MKPPSPHFPQLQRSSSIRFALLAAQVGLRLTQQAAPRSSARCRRCSPANSDQGFGLDVVLTPRLKPPVEAVNLVILNHEAYLNVCTWPNSALEERLDRGLAPCHRCRQSGQVEMDSVFRCVRSTQLATRRHLMVSLELYRRSK